MPTIGPTIGVKGESQYRAALRNIIAETKSLNSEMDLMVSKFSKSDSAIEKNRKTHDQLTKQIEQSKKQLEGFEHAQKLAGEKIEEVRKRQEKANQTYEACKEIMGENNKETKEARAELSKANLAVENSERKYHEWTDKVNQAALELQNLKNQLRDLPKDYQILGQELEKAGGKIEQIGNNLTKWITAPLVGAAGASLKWATEFTDGLAKVYTIAEQSEVPMEEMREQLIALSNQTGFSLEDLTEAEYQAVSASVATSDSIEFLTQATKLARAGFTTTTKSVDVLSTVLNSYGKDAYDVAYISDILLKTQNDGKIVVDQMAEGIGTIIPLASAYNVGLEDIGAALATMTKQGIPASKALTFLRAAFTELEKENSGVNKLLTTLTDHTFAQLMDSGMNLADVLGILYNHVKGDDEQFARLFGNVRSSQATVALAAGNFSILRDEIERMGHATGQTEYALEVLETPALKARKAINRLKNVGVEFGQQLLVKLTPALIKVTDKIAEFSEFVGKMNDRSWKMVTTFVALASAAGPVLTVAGKAVTIVGKLLAGTLPLATGISLVGGAFVALAGAITASEVAAEQHRQELADMYNLTGKYDELLQTSRELTTSYEENNKAIGEKKEATLAELGFAETLIERYNELIDSEGNVKEGYEGIADAILTKLAEAMGMEYEDVQALIEQNGMFGDSIRQNIEDLKARAEAAAQEEYLTEAYRAQYEAKYKLADLESAVAEQREKVRQAANELKVAEEQRNYAIEHGIDVTEQQAQALSDAQTKYDAAKAGLDELEAQVQETTAVYEQSSQTVGHVLEDLAPKTDAAMQNMADTIRIKGREVSTSSEEVGRLASQGLLVDLDDSGYHFVSGFANAIDRYSYLASRSAAQLAYEAKNSLNGSLSIESPSKETFKTGEYFGEGFVLGVEDMMRQASQSAWMLGQNALNSINAVPEMIGTTNYHNVSAPITVAVNVDGSVDDYDALADTIADRINTQVIQKIGAFA